MTCSSILTPLCVLSQLKQNVIEFRANDDNSRWPTVLSVKAQYRIREMQRGFDFKFQATRVQYGAGALERVTGRKSERKGPNIDFELPFAVGTGFVNVLWLDHALRIDRDTSGGKNWLNIYAYDGPVERCRAV